MAKEKTKNVVEEVVQPIVNEDYEEYEEVSLEDRILNIEKKSNASFVLNIVILIVVLLLLVLIVSGGVGSKEETEGTDTTDTTEQVTYDTSAFKTIKASEIKKLSDDKTIVLWIGRQNCGYCAMYAPYMEQAAKDYGLTAMYIDLSTMIDFSTEQAYITDQEEFNTLTALTGKGDWETFVYDNIGGTPLTIIIKNNKVIGGLEGAGQVDDIKAAFKAAGIKKK